ncbi:DNRLRE domain-containing protein [Mariniflexile litorale]|uniref:DNRLRE domain-containing protein n=1 Tax=Mariniflexile litorale TaxID=3045158 RepID=A0AAU7EIK4_9FLAO|nr:DNRLRE domain-containing protein [Mariniflexile sp. KMM 9835]MDQ8209953.1 DNRLRE domain-containing protein [Mariniflexile sp. KMM 9835]
MKNNKITLYASIGVFFTVVLSMFFSCEIQENFSYKSSNSTAELGISAWAYIQKHDSLNLFEEAIKLADVQSLYETSTNKTFVAPTNEAFLNYLEDNAYQSLSDVPVPILRNLIKYHVVDAYVSFDDPALALRNNPIAYNTENGQTMYLSHNSAYTGYVNEGTSQQWTIVTSNLKATNGVIHVIPSIVYFSALSTSSDSPDSTVVMDTIYPLYDTYINGGSASGTNYGNDKLLKVKNVTGNGTYDRKAYIMYDLKDFQKEGSIVELKFELAVSFTHAKFVDLDVYSVQDTLWTETGLTFNNAELPTNTPIATLKTTKVSKFEYDLLDFYKTLDKKRRVSFVLDGEAGSNETDEFHSNQNTLGLNPPMLIARISTGNTVLSINANTGITLNSGETYVLNTATLEVIGSAPADIRYTIEEVPQYGWLIRGANILKVGDRFTQEDIDAMNVVYINNESGSQDKMVLSASDIEGAILDDFDVNITIQ